MIEEFYKLTNKLCEMSPEEREALRQIAERLKEQRLKKHIITSTPSIELPSVQAVLKKRGRKRKTEV